MTVFMRWHQKTECRSVLAPFVHLHFDSHAAPDKPVAKLLAMIDTLKDPAAVAEALKALDAAAEGKEE